MLTGEAPVSATEAVAIFKPWFDKTRGGILLAVSGGPDSIAMMHLAVIAAKQMRRTPALHVATVDHGLRDASRDEALLVLREASALGLKAEMLTWSGLKPTNGLQEAAREARYTLLRAHAQAIGASYLMTAHTLDDQAETVLLRLMRGSGLGGLGAMRVETDIGALGLVRPLLGVPKARLVATCRDVAWPFVDDPSNGNDRFTRVRIRKLLAAFGVEGLNPSRLAKLAERLQRADDALYAMTRAAFIQLRSADGRSVTLAAGGYRRETAECRVRLVALALEEMSRHIARPSALRLERIESLSARLDSAIDEMKTLRTTCGGCRIILSQGKIAFVPEETRQRGQNRDKSSRRAQLGFSPPAP